MKLVGIQLGGEDIIKEKVSYSGIRKYLPKTRKGSALLLFTIWIVWGLLPPAWYEEVVTDSVPLLTHI